MPGLPFPVLLWRVREDIKIFEALTVATVT